VPLHAVTPEEKGKELHGVYPWGTAWPPPQGAGNYSQQLMGPLEGADASEKVRNAYPHYQDGYEYTSPVGSFSANQYGLYDMDGNVWQWCEDKDYNEPDFRADRVMRGGSWQSNVFIFLYSSYRRATEQDMRDCDKGFRIVLEVSP
jgi:formylglycine-generating enzyme required for sulfatase activity